MKVIRHVARSCVVYKLKEVYSSTATVGGAKCEKREMKITRYETRP
jgi:hypothetical protein